MEQSKAAKKWAYRMPLLVAAAICVLAGWSNIRLPTLFGEDSQPAPLGLRKEATMNAPLAAAFAHTTDRGSEVKCSVETNRSVLVAGESQKVIAKVTLTAAKLRGAWVRPPVNLCIVLDRSGSMAGDKIVKAKEAAIEAVKRLTSTDVFSLVAYDHTIKTIIPSAHVGDVEAISTKINLIQPGGRTALFGGVTQGATEIRKRLEERYVHRIILLSDGLANVGPSTPEDLGRLGVSLLKEGISVTTVGVGLDYNEDLMTKLAQKSDGNTYFVESSNDLSQIFAAELGDVLNVTAKNVRFMVECPEGVRPISIIGREGRIHGQKVELALNQLYGGQEKYALLELEVASQPAHKSLEIAAASVRFEDPLEGRSKTVKGVAVVTFSSDKVEVEKSVNASVTTAYEMNLSALAQEQAILLADRGNTREAIEELHKSAARLRSVGERYQDGWALKKAAELEAGALGIETRGYEQHIRKGMRTGVSQYGQQQSYSQTFDFERPRESPKSLQQFQPAPFSLRPPKQGFFRPMLQQQAPNSLQPEQPHRLIEGR
jgi:Ca-activated chloride channel family protein